MATDKVRVSGYVSSDLAGLIDETAQALGQSRSSLVEEVLTNASPVLEALRDMATALAAAPEQHRQALASYAAALAPLVAEVESGFGGLESGVLDPPPTNRGVRK
jgi:ABC-type transporter Mla subunit MlaD